MLNKKEYVKNFSWDFYSKLIIISYFVLQIIRWQILPQFMDIYYHFLTAWGFIQAGGYSGWDFWQYAPVGRIHIYPPLFHIILAFLIKLGISKVILAKFFEVIMPVIFLIVLWNLIRKNYNECLAFFVTVMFSSSFSFYLSLLNHIPATLAFILGFLAFDQLFQSKFLRASLMLALCFYTHIGVSWFFAFSFLFYSLFNKQHRKSCYIIFIFAFILSLPILLKQLAGIKFISSLGINLNEKYICQIKIIDYVLAIFGLILALRLDKKYHLFSSFLFASFIFLIYPYRFFSAEGYLPVILLSALFLYNLYEKFKHKRLYLKYLPILATVFILFFSPTVSMDRIEGKNKLSYKLHISDSAFMGMLLARGKSIWFPREYLSAADLIKNNSEEGDIVYSSLNIAGVILASMSGRSTANALFPEIHASRQFDPILASKIIVFAKDESPEWINRIINNYNLTKIGENKIFILYRNPFCYAKVNVKKASLSFLMIGLISAVFMLLLWLAKNYSKLIFI